MTQIEMIQEAVRSRLLNDDRIRSFIGERIFPLRAPEKSDFPLITTQVYDVEITHTQDGDERIDRTQFLLGIWDKSYHGAQKIYNLCRQVLSDYVCIDIITITLQRVNETYDEKANAYGVSLHFEVTNRFLELTVDEHWDFLLTSDDKKIIFN